MYPPPDRPPFGPSVATLQRFLDRVPLPPGAALTAEGADGPGVDVQAHVDRTYRLTTATPGTQVRSTLAAAGFRVVGRHHEAEAPVTAPIWSTYAGAATGDVDVRPPGTPTGVVDVRWNGTMLIIAVSGGDID